MSTPPYAVGTSLDGAGDAPGAWRLAAASDLTAFDGRPARDAAVLAESAGLVFATLDDALALQPDEPGRVRGRLDALATACWLGPQTSRIGLLPTVTLTHTEPFHVSTATATLDLVSEGRAGVVVDVSTDAASAAAIGRRAPAPADVVWGQAEDVVEAVARLWDSWEDDAEVRDVATSRFVDRERLHYVDAPVRTGDPAPDGLTGAFTVRGPSIVPRTPQGRPVVAVRLPAGERPGSARWRASALRADLVLLGGSDLAGTQDPARLVRAGAEGRELRVLASLRVVLGDDDDHARRRAQELDALGTDDAPVFVGTAEALAAELVRTSTTAGGWLDGVELRPAVLADDLPRIARDLAPRLAAAGLLTDAPPGSTPPGSTLRSRLGLPRPASRYARAEVPA
ncbi:LLM class flavin-dependent oxidoreductase [Kineococcus rubinsiae]|uniref:LLM class flavin-dependent oxidoreductase n=1 Tax=Kineococcus rubinsiae TaxID=2609562 RepID=UPI00142F7438|nr:LLM class flavin-dependent oxidoreductase [Kineococcus rubinsiae]NIZ91001.1 LLM class flavin-dependent oxidoreductase [Kineococcus rubinsiae]